MGIYPVSVKVKPYRGADPRKKEKYMDKIHLAKKLENHINKKMKNKEILKFTYGFLASDFDITETLIKELLATIDGGSTGVTVCTEEYWSKHFGTT